MSLYSGLGREIGVQIDHATLMLRQHSRNFGDLKVAADEFVEI